MPLYSTDALILRTYRLSDADRIVVFLTRDRGKKRGVAKGARRLRSRFVGALEPLTRVSMVYFEKENRELVSLNHADAVRSPLSAHHPDAVGYVGYLAELIDEWAPEGDPDERLFRLGASVLDALADDVPVEAVVRYFEYWLLRLQGVYPSVASCQQCGAPLSEGARLLSAARALLCRACGAGAVSGAAALSPAAVAFLRAAGRLGPSRLGEVPLPPGAARELAHAHRTLIAWHLDKELRSTRVLREMQH
jgi:DNA repair protein RecO (recombination protein O)